VVCRFRVGVGRAGLVRLGCLEEDLGWLGGRESVYEAIVS
jgi:hypothetical protein